MIIISLKERIESAISNISRVEFEKMINYIKFHYTEKGYIVNKEFLIDFYLTSYSTSIWYEALNNSLLESNFNKIMDLEEENWEKCRFNR
ncbi:hypothetical protein CWO92_18525 [Heyndrickxia camelliae]|uniref:Uncharacterized protein n=1 Tax=Heyndrickxia camelliae TaxID=1707093 RepID=A0A2N3LG15_9BACI|nr:hypothetical protein CWO92_18525 [Heyndrickxia camelliae]